MYVCVGRWGEKQERKNRKRNSICDYENKNRDGHKNMPKMVVSGFLTLYFYSLNPKFQRDDKGTLD